MTAKDSTNRRPATVWTLMLLVGFLSLSGFHGGIALLRDPSGGLIGFPAEMIKRLPIQNYMLPGLFLLVIYGCGGAFVVYGLASRSKRARSAAILLGIILLVWIVVQVWLLGPPVAVLQIIYFVLGTAIAGVSWLPSVKRHHAQ
jgi:hypothetical protein